MHDPVEILNRLLQSEQRIIHSYKIVVDRVHNQQLKVVTRHCLDLHLQASEKLTARLRALGEPPAVQAGIVQVLAMVAGDVATIFGDHAIKASLEKRELDRLEELAYDITCLDGENLRLVKDELSVMQESNCTCLKSVQL